MAAIPPTATTALLGGGDGVLGARRGSTASSMPGYGTNGDEEASFAKNPELDTTWKAETKILSRYSIPLILTYILQYSLSLVTVYVAGRLGTLELGAASLATMTANITGLCVYEGLATSLDTLTSQAFGNAKYHLVGLQVQRMGLLVCLVTVPIGAVWICSPWILSLLVPEKELAILAGDFLRIYLIGAPGWGMFEAGKRFTQAQGNFHASLIVSMVCAPINILLNYLIVFRLDMGFQGAALAVAISNDLQPIVLALYVRFFAPSTLKCWPGLDLKRAATGWGPMVRLSIPGVIMTFSEWFAFDILTFSSSYLSAEHLAAQSVVMTVSVTMYHIPFPISIAASTRFGNLIGHGAIKAARTAWRTHYLIFLFLGTMDLVILTCLRHVIAIIFTDDPAVQVIVTNTLPIVAAAQLFDATTAISNGLLRGLGRQKIGGWVNLGVYYLFALPLSFVLTFGPPHLELLGLWIGPCIGLGCGSLIMAIYMKWTDWEKAVEDARSREE